MPSQEDLKRERKSFSGRKKEDKADPKKRTVASPALPSGKADIYHVLYSDKDGILLGCCDGTNHWSKNCPGTFDSAICFKEGTNEAQDYIKKNGDPNNLPEHRCIVVFPDINVYPHTDGDIDSEPRASRKALQDATLPADWEVEDEDDEPEEEVVNKDEKK